MAIYVRDEKGVLQAWEIPAYKGEKGEAGITPNLQIGDVITLESGQQATVVRRGDDENPIFDFAIPKGEDGKDGIFVGSVDDAPDYAQIVINDDASPYDLFYEDANVSYMGDTYTSLKEKADADIEYLLRKFGTQHYEETNITATDTYQKQVKSAILKGKTGYRDKDTGEILDAFEDGRNLELVSVKSPIVTVIGKNLIGECINPSERYRNYKSHLKPNTRYSLIYKNSDGSNTSYGEVGLLNGNVQVFLGYANAMYFTTPPSTNDSTLLYIDTWFKEISVLLAEGEINLYLNLRDILKEPPKSHTLTTPSNLTLRGIGNTQDTLDLVDGKKVERVDEIILDGTNTSTLYFLEPNRAQGYTVFPMRISDVFPNMTEKYNNSTKLLSNNFNYLANAYTDHLGGKWMCINTMYFILSIPNDELESLDIQGLNKWLSSNPTTIYYPSKSTTRTIDLSNQKVYSYDDTTHYTTASAQDHPAPILSIDVPTNTTKMIARQREEIEQQERKLQEQEEIQNLLIESQLAWFEDNISTLELTDEGTPSHIQKLYELTRKRKSEEE